MSDLSRLIRLQELDVQIDQLKERAREVPGEIERLAQELEQGRAALEEAQSLNEEARRTRRDLESQVEQLRERLSRYKTQLMEVKTNKEYQAMLHEIEITSQEIECKEDQILEQMMVQDESEEKIRAVSEVFSRDQKAAQDKEKELQAFAERVSSEIEQLKSQREELAHQIPLQLSDQYRRIAQARNGLALAEARDQSCLACNVKLRPQLFADIKARKGIITCESCNRILYYGGA